MNGTAATRVGGVGGAPSAPERLGPCRLLRLLGSGGMGTVYLAEMVEDRPYAATGTRVALKVLRPELLPDRDILQRFRRECELGAGFDHPCLVRSYELSSEEAGSATVHFMILEYVEGQTLRDLMTRLGVVPEALLLDLAAQIAGGLNAVHAGNAVHRDLKPENVLITPDHRVKIMDLGVARLLGEGTRLTSTGVFLGTVHYAAPEQCAGKEVGPGADLYALGILMYEAACGRLPFQTEDLAGLLRAHLEETPQRLRSINPNITSFLEEVVACLLEKDPESRFPSALELSRVLEAGESAEWWRERQHTLRALLPRGPFRPIRVGLETRLVGREEESGLLHSLVGDMMEGRGSLVLMEGEAGVGKSRILHDLIQDLEEEEVLILCGAHAPGTPGSDVSALAGALIAHFGEAGLDRRLSGLLSGTPRLAPAFASLLRGEPAPAGARSLSAEAVQALFCDLARALSAEMPVVWIVEDLHYAPPSAHALLLSLARILHDQRLLIVATSRPGLPHDTLAAFERLEACRRLRLGRLGADDVTRILGEALGSDALAERLGPDIASKSDGNPYFVFEILRELREGDLLSREPDGSYAFARHISEVEVPSSVRELLLARLKDLDDEDRVLLEVGAVQGHSFDPDLVARVLEMKRLQVLQTLAAVERRSGVLQATGRGFAFDHVQLQEVLYGSLAPMLRCEYHLLLAEAYVAKNGLAGLSPDAVPGEASIFLARHLLGAEETERAAGFLPAALERLSATHQNEALLDLAEATLRQVGQADGELRFAVRMRQADCLCLLGRRDQERAALEDAIGVAQDLDDEAKALRARSALGRLLITVSDYPEARKILDGLLEGARALGDGALEARTHAQLGLVHFNLGDYDEARRHCEAGVERARSAGDSQGEVVAAGNLGSICRHLGLYDEARGHFERSIVLAREIGDRRNEAGLTGSLGIFDLDHGRYQEARGHLERQIALCREIGDRRCEAVARANLGKVLSQEGLYKGAREHMERAGALFRAIDDRRALAALLGNVGQAAVEEGRLEEGEDQLRQCLDLAHELGLRRVEGYALLDMGDLARALERDEGAESRYREALALLQDLGIQEGAAAANLALGRHLLQIGRGEEARGHLREADRLSTDLGLAELWVLPRAYLALLDRGGQEEIAVGPEAPARVRAETHVVLHRIDGSREHLAEAREILQRMSAHLDPAGREVFWKLNPVARALVAEEEAGSSQREGPR